MQMVVRACSSSIQITPIISGEPYNKHAAIIREREPQSPMSCKTSPTISQILGKRISGTSWNCCAGVCVKRQTRHLMFLLSLLIHLYSLVMHVVLNMLAQISQGKRSVEIQV